MLHNRNGMGLFKKVTISAALVGAFSFASFVGDFDTNVASASELKTNQVLRVGSKGGDVVHLQSKLKAQNYLNGRADGIYGPQTRNAVTKFQRNKKLAVDGIAGPQTLRALSGTKAKAGGKSSSSAVKSSTVLRQGSRGQAVKTLQSKLKNLKYLNSSVDGVYGADTTRAVRAFQRANGLSADGIAGAQTFNALNKGKPAAKTKAKSSAKASSLVSTAKSVIGTKYKWGGTTPSGFDCSGFLNYVYKKQGVNIPRTVSQIWSSGKKVSNPKVGDVVFFNTAGGPSHAGIYLGNNQFIHSGTSTGVTISSLNNSYWKPRYMGAKSVL